MNRRCFLSATAGWLAAHSLLPAQPRAPRWVQIVDDFTRGSGGWLAEFSDYDFSQGGMERMAEVRPLPAETGREGQAYFLQGVNRSDDLFMFLKKPLTAADGITPEATYDVAFLVEFASQDPTGCFGVGGSPGDAVYLKVGASPIEPVPVLGSEGLRLNLDKGQQSQSGQDATVTGTIANGLPCEPENQRFTLVERRSRHTNPVQAAGNGELWIFVGTDSAFEGLTQLYYARIVVLLTLLGG